MIPGRTWKNHTPPATNMFLHVDAMVTSPNRLPQHAVSLPVRSKDTYSPIQYLTIITNLTRWSNNMLHLGYPAWLWPIAMLIQPLCPWKSRWMSQRSWSIKLVSSHHPSGFRQVGNIHILVQQYQYITLRQSNMAMEHSIHMGILKGNSCINGEFPAMFW